MPWCRQIVKIWRPNIEGGYFPEGSCVRHIMDDIMEVVQGALVYCRYRVRVDGIIEGRGRGGGGRIRGARGRGDDTSVVCHTQ